MDPRNAYPRTAGLPSGPGPAGRSPQRGPSQQAPSTSTGSTATRAERFEDEKRRIMESCFSKFDETGQLAESYITHIRITEDAGYPQTPHPPESPTANKERLIIVAVRNTGRVRVHKARENANHTFSIGKTWNLEDLSAVQSWANYTPKNEEEVKMKGWAGEIGFTVTIIKPYYWQASTAKEKEFFVASLIKIYRKYTQGKVPDLIGFPPRDVEQMVGGQPRVGSAGNSPGRPPQIPPFSPGRPRGPSSGDIPTSSPQLPLEPPPRNRPTTAGSGSGTERSFFAQRSPSSQSSTPPPGSMYSLDPRKPNRAASQEQMRSSGPPGARITPNSSVSNLGPPRTMTPDSFNSRTDPVAPGPDGRSISQTRDETSSRNGSRGPNGLGIVNRSNGVQFEDNVPTSLRPGLPNGRAGSNSSFNGSQESLQETAVPERRRPPMVPAPSNGSQTSLRPGPANGTRGGLMGSASASTDSLVKGKMERMPGGFVTSPSASEQLERDGIIPPPLSPRPKAEAPAPAPVAAVVSPPPAAPAVGKELKEEVESKPMPVMTEAEAKRAEEEEAARPGLGRMFGNKQRTAKDLFKTAASAYGAFVPRAKGAGARIRGVGEEGNDKGPDGMTAVVPAPGLLNRTRTDESMKVETPKDESSIQATPTSVKVNPVDDLTQGSVPQVTISSPISPQNNVLTPPPPPAPEAAQEAAALSAQQKKAKGMEEEAARRKKRRSAQQLKYLSRLGVDGSILENKGLEFESVLDDIGWGNSAFQAKSIEALEADIRREISRAEAGSWLGHLEQKDDRVEAVEKLLDKAIAECDELDGLLTLYSVELGSLNDDIAFIEAQSQGLQVQTANQKLLQSELQNLVNTISISSRQLEPLKKPMPSNPQGLDAIEQALLMLYKAMVTIDPSIRQSANASGNQGNSGIMANSELSSMVALQQKSDQYLGECAMFLKRFTQHMDLTFGASILAAKDVVSRQRGANGAKLSTEPYEAARAALWQYSPLMLFAKEIDRSSWDLLLKQYQGRAKPLYQDEFRDNVQTWKKLARKPTGDEAELLFTFSSEKEGESLTGTARRITVKRSQTLAKGLRAASGEKDRAKNIQTGSLFPFEAFSGALDEMTPLISVEQNFVVEFFHATGTETIDFADAVTAAPPEARRGGNIYSRKAFEPDRELARRVTSAMEEIFAVFPSELASLLEWAVKTDPLQGIGIMHAIHRTALQYEDTNQDFLTRTMATVAQRLGGMWIRFVDEQIRAIEDTKVKIKKRKGVIAFVKTFPNFSAAIEYQLPPTTEEGAANSETRALVDQAYERIVKAMFESLRVIAKESPGAGAGVSASLHQAQRVEDPEDKEALNYHVLLIENMNHFIEEVDARGDAVLEEGKSMASEEFEDHLGMYVEAVIRRPLGKVIDFIDQITLSLSALPPTQLPTVLATRTQTSRSTFKKVLQAHDQKELRRGIEALRKRVEKHFMDGDEMNLSRELVGKVLGKCEEKYKGVFERLQDIGREVYEGGLEGLEVLGTREEVARWFRGGR